MNRALVLGLRLRNVNTAGLTVREQWRLLESLARGDPVVRAFLQRAGLLELEEPEGGWGNFPDKAIAAAQKAGVL